MCVFYKNVVSGKGKKNLFLAWHENGHASDLDVSGSISLTIGDLTAVEVFEMLGVTLKVSFPHHIVELERDKALTITLVVNVVSINKVEVFNIRDRDRLHSSFIVLHGCIMTEDHRIGRLKLLIPLIIFAYKGWVFSNLLLDNLPTKSAGGGEHYKHFVL
jgi:hypothetical protein